MARIGTSSNSGSQTANSAFSKKEGKRKRRVLKLPPSVIASRLEKEKALCPTPAVCSKAHVVNEVKTEKAKTPVQCVPNPTKEAKVISPSINNNNKQEGKRKQKPKDQQSEAGNRKEPKNESPTPVASSARVINNELKAGKAKIKDETVSKEAVVISPLNEENRETPISRATATSRSTISQQPTPLSSLQPAQTPATPPLPTPSRSQDIELITRFERNFYYVHTQSIQGNLLQWQGIRSHGYLRAVQLIQNERPAYISAARRWIARQRRRKREFFEKNVELNEFTCYSITLDFKNKDKMCPLHLRKMHKEIWKSLELCRKAAQGLARLNSRSAKKKWYVDSGTLWMEK